MKNINSFKLFESPDGIKSQGLKHNNDDTYAFGYVDGIMRVKYNGIHSDIFKEIPMDDYIDGYKINKLDKLIEWRSDNRLGRLWEKSKIISFWDYPKNNNELHQIIKDIEKETNINIWNDNEWKIEIYEIGDKSVKSDITEHDIKKGVMYDEDYNIIPLKSKLISLKSFISSLDVPNEEAIIHSMTPIEKEKYYIANPEKRPKITSTKSEKDFAWRQALNQTESTINVINFKLFESPDGIKSRDLTHKDADAYAFGYVDGVMKIAYNGVHYDIFNGTLINHYMDEYNIETFMLEDNDGLVDMFDDIEEFTKRVENNEITEQDVECFYGISFEEYLSDFKTGGEYDDLFMEWRSDNRLGRLWESSKIISFWDYPTSNNELHQIIKDIEKETNINIWDDREWKIEIYEIKDKSVKRDVLNNLDINEYDLQDGVVYTTDNDELDVTSKLISLREFTFSVSLPEELKIHLMSPIEKEKYYKAHPEKRPKNTSTNSAKSLAWRQAINRSESVMKNIDGFKLFESPNMIGSNPSIDYREDVYDEEGDRIETPENPHEHIAWDSEDAYAFGIIDGEFEIKADAIHAELYEESIGKDFIRKHPITREMVEKEDVEDLASEYDDVDELLDRVDNGDITFDDVEFFHDISFDEFRSEVWDNNDIEKWRIERDKFLGRLWVNSKVISFWDYPKNNNELHAVINEIEKGINIKIWNDPEWKIEILIVSKEDKDKAVSDNQGSLVDSEGVYIYPTYKLIPLTEFTTSIDTPEEELQFHLMSVKEKERLKMKRSKKGIGSDKYADKKPLAWRQALNKSESVMNFTDFMNEDVQPLPQVQTQSDVPVQQTQEVQPEQAKVIPLGKFKDVIDYTYLKSGATKQNITDLIDIAIENKFYAVCVPIDFVDHAKFLLEDTDIKLVSVLDFPDGKSNITENLNDAIKLISNGVDEIDMVIDHESFQKAYKSTDEDVKVSTFNNIEKEIKVIADECHKNGTILKVIIESGLLTLEEITKVCEIISNAGADFIQTSTGTKGIGTELSKVKEIRRVINDYIKIKVAGGIRTIQDCEKFYPYVDRIGTSVVPR